MLPPGESWSRNQTRSCGKESGIGRSRGTRPDGRQLGHVLGRARRLLERPGQAGHGRLLEHLAPWAARRSNACRTRDASRATSSECPPSWKKSSWMPTRSTPEQVAPDLRQHLLHRRCAARRSRRRGPAGPGPGAGRARRSTLPLAVSGSAAGRRRRPGPCTRAGVSLRRCRSSATVDARRRRPGRHRPPAASRPGASSRAATTARARPAGARSAASISPSSMRKPRTFT